MPRGRQIVGLCVWLAMSFIVAALGGLASMNAADFYAQLVRPAWAPPAWIFGPVWSVLYLSMAIAAWLVWRERGFLAARVPLLLFMLQLAVNGLWSWLFFAWHRGLFALVDILTLWVLIGATIATFWRVRPAAGALLIPYWLWVSFATALNYAIWHLNATLLG